MAKQLALVALPEVRTLGQDFIQTSDSQPVGPDLFGRLNDPFAGVSHIKYPVYQICT